MKNPIIKKGDVLCSGETYFDGEHREFHLIATGYAQDNRCIVPKQAVSDMELLGVELTDHWNLRIQDEGHRASHEIEYRDFLRPISPHIAQFLSGNLKNSQVTSILEEEY